ncbi:MAG: DUF1778 domain-containing protein [Gammaproteobacteria bacterium]
MMNKSTRTERIEMRVQAETKLLAERASAVLGCDSVTEYVVRLIHENAPAVLEREATITLTNAQFDRFMAACQDESVAPSRRILKAAERLDRDGTDTHKRRCK